jgi:hypothetical protein
MELLKLIQVKDLSFANAPQRPLNKKQWIFEGGHPYKQLFEKVGLKFVLKGHSQKTDVYRR